MYILNLGTKIIIKPMKYISNNIVLKKCITNLFKKCIVKIYWNTLGLSAYSNKMSIPSRLFKKRVL